MTSSDPRRSAPSCPTTRASTWCRSPAPPPPGASDHGGRRGDHQARLPRARRQVGEHRPRRRRPRRAAAAGVAFQITLHAGQGCAITTPVRRAARPTRRRRRGRGGDDRQLPVRRPDGSRQPHGPARSAKRQRRTRAGLHREGPAPRARAWPLGGGVPARPADKGYYVEPTRARRRRPQGHGRPGGDLRSGAGRDRPTRTTTTPCASRTTRCTGCRVRSSAATSSGRTAWPGGSAPARSAVNGGLWLRPRLALRRLQAERARPRDGRRRASRSTSRRRRSPRGPDERDRPHHRRGRRPAARAHRHPRAAPACRRTTAARRTTRSATSPIAYGDDNPLWCDPDYGAEDPLGASRSRRRALVGGDTLIGEDEVTAVAPEHRDLMKGDPLRGVHAFYAGQRARVVGAVVPAAPGRSAATRSSACSTSRASSPAGRSTSGPRRCSATTTGTLLSGQYRLMIRTEREKARERKKYDAIELAAVHRRRRSPRSTRSTRRERPRGAEPRWWEDVARGRRGRPDGEGPAHRHRHGLLARGHGHGPLRREAAAARRTQNRQRIPRFFHRDDLNVPDVHAARALGPRVRAPVGQPDHLRLRPHARDVAHPPLHRLDGRRRVAVEARLRVPQVQLRRRHAVAARARSPASTSPTATGPRSTSSSRP